MGRIIPYIMEHWFQPVMYLYLKKQQAKHVISPHGPLLNPPFHPIIGSQIQVARGL